MKIFAGQINPTVGALHGNRELIEGVYREGTAAGADLVMVTELAITGYPPRDLLERDDFIREANLVRDQLASMTGPVPLIFGCPTPNRDPYGKRLRNSAIVAMNGQVVFEQHKTLLPTYDVFDELRYFEPAEEVAIWNFAGRAIGLAICEDFWFEERIGDSRLYQRNPIEELVNQGADLLLNISASPFNLGKQRIRCELFREIALRFSVPLVYVNQVGGNDELLFDGSSMVIDAEGKPIWSAPPFESTCELVDLDVSARVTIPRLGEEMQIAEAVQLGLRDYLRKVGFSRVVIGLSGGIDSAVTAALAAEAIGAENVTGIAMPSQFSSTGSVDDARALADNLGIAFLVAPIADIYASYRKAFDEMFGDRAFGLTDENVQARIRGSLLMAWSNRNGAMLLTTGNKSELAVGYCTLYGDMAGGLSLLGDVYKTSVYAVARWINRNGEVIPEASITKPPSAELRPNQTDQDTLPPYELLDAILKAYIEEGKELDAIVESGHDRQLVATILHLVDANEFKRWQAAPTIRVTTKAFGSGRQFPIAQRWRHETSR